MSFPDDPALEALVRAAATKKDPWPEYEERANVIVGYYRFYRGKFEVVVHHVRSSTAKGTIPSIMRTMRA